MFRPTYRPLVLSARLRQLAQNKTRAVLATKPANISQFQHENSGIFQQAKPELKNPYITDELLNDVIKRYCPPEHFERVSADLTRMGDRIVNEIDALGEECEANPPTLKRTDAYGDGCARWHFRLLNEFSN